MNSCKFPIEVNIKIFGTTTAVALTCLIWVFHLILKTSK